MQMATKGTEIATVDPREVALNERLAELKQKLESIVVANDNDYRDVCQIRLDGQAFVKSVGFEKDPEIASAKSHWEFLKGRKARLVDPAEVIIEAAKKKSADYNEQKRLADEAETRRQNEKRRVEADRKAAEEKRIADAKAEEDRKIREAK